MVVDSLVYHPAVTHYNKFVATTVGRDKALRTIQYFSRFLAWYLLRTAPSSSPSPDTKILTNGLTTPATLTLLKSNLGLVRKCLRLGKFIEHFRAAATSYDARGIDTIIKYLAVGRQLGYGFYLALDACTYLDAAGIRKSEFAKRMQVLAYKAWLCGLVCSACSGVYSLWMLRQSLLAQKGKGSKGGDVERKVEEKRISKEWASVRTQLVSDVCDLTIPSSALGYVELSDGVVGMAGTISSLIGLSAQWAKTA